MRFDNKRNHSECNKKFIEVVRHKLKHSHLTNKSPIKSRKFVPLNN